MSDQLKAPFKLSEYENYKYNTVYRRPKRPRSTRATEELLEEALDGYFINPKRCSPFRYAKLDTNAIKLTVMTDMLYGRGDGAKFSTAWSNMSTK